MTKLSTLAANRYEMSDALPVPKRLTEHDWPDGTSPFLSICCYTYNQADLISETIESFLMQATDFPVEILLHDDASTDGTSDIVRAYQARYPALVRAVVQTENQYSKKRPLLPNLLLMAGGQYVALCEGDDYWVAEDKLQKQVNYMKAYPDVKICFHDAVKVTIGQGGNIIERHPFFPVPPNSRLTFDNFVRGFAPHTSSCVIRNERNLFVPLDRFELSFAMTVFFSLLADGGEAAFIAEQMSVYRVHARGIYSCIDAKEQLEMSNRGLWVCRRYFRSPRHRDLFSLSLVDNYTVLLKLALQNMNAVQALSASASILYSLFIPPSLLVQGYLVRRLLRNIRKIVWRSREARSAR